MPSPEFNQFVDNQSSALAKARVRKTLETNQGFNRIFKPRYQGIERLVGEGRTIVIARNGERRLQAESGGFFNEKDTTKTGMDFAEFLISRRKGNKTLKTNKFSSEVTPSSLSFGRKRGL